MRELNVGVVGAGIGGLTAAALLADRGDRVTIFDRFDAPAPVGSGLVVQPTGRAVLAMVGALDRALSLGCLIGRMHGTDTGRPVLDVSYGAAEDHGLAIHRAALSRRSSRRSGGGWSGFSATGRSSAAKAAGCGRHRASSARHSTSSSTRRGRSRRSRRSGHARSPMARSGAWSTGSTVRGSRRTS